MTTQPPKENTYVLGHTEAEKTRLIEQDRFFTKAMGGLFPEQPDLSGVRSLLDVACGPGGWALEVAQAHPNMKVVAIDIDAGMIKYAKDLAQASRLNNVTFLEMNALEPLDFDDGSFDLVNGRFLGGFIPTAYWPEIVQEFLRIMRPGGILRLTDAAWDAETSSPSYHAIVNYLILATQCTQLSFSPDARHYSINMMLSRFLRQAGCTNIQEMAHVFNFSYGTPYHRPFYEDSLVAFKLMQPFQVGTGVVTQAELDQLYETLQLEMLKEDFTGILYMLTAWGKKGESR